MSVAYLVRLMESGQYEECLAEAAALLEKGEQSPESLARIYGAICRSHLALGEYWAAVEAGEQAAALAQEAGAPDVRGAALADLGTALARVREYQRALQRFQEYLAGLDEYTAARCLEGEVRQRMAEVLDRCGRPAEALKACRAARDWFRRYGDERSAALCSRTMMRLCLETARPQEAVRHLAAVGRYAAKNPEDHRFVCDYLMDRAVLLLALGDAHSAAGEAFRALEHAGDRLDQVARCQLLLARCALVEDLPREALTFALAARISAIDGRVYDLEMEASDLLFRLLRTHGERLLREVEGDFRDVGLDIGQYLSEEVLRRIWQGDGADPA
ncbi:MAG TPA: hypothetical protein VIL07_09380 [Symbiobacteriaceae bacterium]